MNDVDVSRLGPALIATAAGIGLLMAFTITTARRRHKHSVVDVAWGLGFAVVAVVSFTVTVGTGDLVRRLLALFLPLLWGLRLAFHVARRNAGQAEDPRYRELLAQSPDAPAVTALRRIYLPQALVMFVVSLPIPLAATTEPPMQWWAWMGVAMWALGLFFEAVGDRQLSRFKADPTNHGKVMDTGLWRYTRHPNYFGDACIWWGIWLVAAASWAGLAVVVAPVLMTYLLVAKTGKPLLERSMTRSKPGYADYVSRTSGFVPLPPKRT